MALASALYVGSVMHRRLKPHRHRLRYGVFSLLLDLDELPQLHARLRWFSCERFNLLSFRAADYGFGEGPLKAQVERMAREAGFETGGPVRLLTMPRFLGYAFNPLNVFFVHGPDGVLSAVVAEVNNTFGERHAYVMSGEVSDELVRACCAKRFYVSPFNDMDLTYDFRVRPPGGEVLVGIAVADSAGPLMSAVQTAGRFELDDPAILRTCVRYPLLGLKVIGGIHWEALKLWLKGLKLRDRPAPPQPPVTPVPRAKGRG